MQKLISKKSMPFIKIIIFILVSNTINAQTLKFCDKGLNIFPLNSMLDINSVHSSKIDTSMANYVEYANAVRLDYDESLNLYLKLNLDKYSLPVEGINYIYLGLKDFEIQRIAMNVDYNSLPYIVTLFNQLYTPSGISEMSIDDDVYSTRIWKSGKYEIYLSGITRTIVFNYRK